MELKQSKVFILVPQMYVQNVCVKKFAPSPPPKHASQKNELHMSKNLTDFTDLRCSDLLKVSLSIEFK